MRTLKVIFVSAEVAPFAKVGGLGDVAGSLPYALSSIPCDIRVFLPYYSQAKKQDFGIALLRDGLAVNWNGKEIPFSLYHTKRKDVNFYFIGKDEYFDREFIYNPPSGDYPDNAARFAFFSEAVLKSAPAIGFTPDIIHCNDWHTALIPFYIKHRYNMSNAKSLLTIHNIAHQGVFRRGTLDDIGIEGRFFTQDALECAGKLNIMKAGVVYADAINAVSRGYAAEILTKEFGCGLENLLRSRKGSVSGIISGVDYSEWNPAIDKFIKANYDKDAADGKSKCKDDLLAETGIGRDRESPLLGMVSRLADQKGIDIVINSMADIVRLGCSLVIQGSGDVKSEESLLAMANKYPRNLAVRFGYDDTFAHRIVAGCDMFLVPSRFEPCGLTQLYSLKYGTIPLATAVGGLDDTITDYTHSRSSGNGFKFKKAEKNGLVETIKRALAVYRNKKEWKELSARAMGLDFSWRRSAGEYMDLYRRIMAGKTAS